MRTLAPLGPPLAWMAVILILSGDLLSGDVTGSWLLPLLARLLPETGPAWLHGLHGVVRTMGHLVEFGILAALWLPAVAPGRSARGAAAWAVGLAALWAVADELRQGLTATRSPAGLDVAIDTVGAVLAVAACQAPGTGAALPIRLLRWAALGLALASLGAALVDWTLGLAAGDLLLAGLAALAGAWALGRLGAMLG